MATRIANIEIQDLTEEAKTAAAICGEWLRKEAKFEPLLVGSETSGYEVCIDNDALVEVSHDFIKHFHSSMKA
ncbi:hypothetical protein B7494_g349 [Chlorociboria aeruginascens]|nr:hypothetical protein B7494_g349 [Chlorociboria aeruginascens]